MGTELDFPKKEGAIKKGPIGWETGNSIPNSENIFDKTSYPRQLYKAYINTLTNNADRDGEISLTYDTTTLTQPNKKDTFFEEALLTYPKPPT